MNSSGQYKNIKIIDFYEKYFFVIGIIFIIILSLKSIFIFLLNNNRRLLRNSEK